MEWSYSISLIPVELYGYAGVIYSLFLLTSKRTVDVYAILLQCLPKTDKIWNFSADSCQWRPQLPFAVRTSNGFIGESAHRTD